MRGPFPSRSHAIVVGRPTAAATTQDGEHLLAEHKVHPIFHNFERFDGEVDGIFHYDYLGVRTDPKFWRNTNVTPRGRHLRDYPLVGEQYFEWIFVAETAWACRHQNSFTMVELGAGYGTWLLRAHHSFRQLSDSPISLVGVEGDVHHYQWMREHFTNNGLDPAGHHLLLACVSDTEGMTAFMDSDNPDAEYGLKGLREDGVHKSLAEEEVGRVFNGDDGQRYRTVRSVTLDGLIQDLERVDLIHMDIEGYEYRVVSQSMKMLNEKAARLLIGTHSAQIEDGLRRLLGAEGWTAVYDYEQAEETETEWGPIRFVNGCQAWTNPRMEETT